MTVEDAILRIKSLEGQASYHDGRLLALEKMVLQMRKENEEQVRLDAIFDVITDNRLKKLDSFMRESQRFNPLSFRKCFLKPLSYF